MSVVPRLLLLLGPPGVGKTSIIRALCERDSRFVYVAPYTTRELRPGEMDKVHVSDEALDSLWMAGELVIINELHGARYGTPRRLIAETLAEHRFPVIDWPADRVASLRASGGFPTFTLYIAPRTPEQLSSQLESRDGDAAKDRWSFAARELARFHASDFDADLDDVVTNDMDCLDLTVDEVHTKYIDAITERGV